MSQVGVPHRNATHDHKGQNTPQCLPTGSCWFTLVHHTVKSSVLWKEWQGARRWGVDS